jgi:epoxyqueuosine reductase
MEQGGREHPGPDEAAGVRLKEEIIAFATERGADLVGFAPAERWDEFDEVPADFRPRSIWPPVRTVIVLAMAMPLPIVETTPSVPHMELYRTVNAGLDRLAYDVTRYLNRRGHASSYFTHDGFSSLRALREHNLAAFSHVMAAKYAGLGTIGLSRCLLTPEFGPRVRFVSVFTEAELPPDAVLCENLCTACGLCAACCPKGALIRGEGGREDMRYDKTACLEMAEQLTRRRCYPCGTCIKVCPVGEDRRLYGATGRDRKYRREREVLERDPAAAEYKAWSHVRKYGSPHEGDERGGGEQ